jgi:hypothetical protein
MMKWLKFVPAKQSIIPLMLIFFSSLHIQDGHAQPNLDMSLKNKAYRIIGYWANSTQTATGVMFSEGPNCFLVTNLHVIKNDSNVICDSITVFLNRNLSNGDVMSGPDKFAIYLKGDESELFFRATIPTIDLVLIPVRRNNSTLVDSDSLYSVTTSSIIDLAKLRSKIDSTAIVTIVGFPGKESVLKERTPEYIWGDLTFLEKGIFKSNAPVLSGNSGSLAVLRARESYYLLGIHWGHDPNTKTAIGIPGSYIPECFGKYFEVIRKKNNE